MKSLKHFFSSLILFSIFTTSLFAVTVDGVVVDDDGIAVAGALIKASAVDSTNFGQYTTTSNNDGSFLLELGDPGSYFFEIFHPDYLTGSFGPLFIASNTTLTFSLQSNSGTVSFAGKVLDEFTFLPIQGAYVEISNQNIVVISDSTDVSGNFSFNDIPLGQYQFSASKLGYGTFIQTLNFNSPGNIGNISIYLTSDSIAGQASAQGLIYYYNSSGIFSPVPNAQVAFSHTTLGLIFETTSNDTGFYQVDGMVPGEYLMIVFADGFFMPLEPKIVNITNGINEIDFEMLSNSSFPSGIVSGQVTLDGTNQPVAEAFIQLMPVSPIPPAPFNLSASTDAIGNYSITAPEGDYYVQLFVFYDDSTFFPYMEYYDDAMTIDDAAIISVSVDQTLSGIDFGIPVFEIFSVTVEGVVTDEQNVAIPDALVEVLLNGNDYGLFWRTYTTQSNPDGSYSLQIDDFSTITPSFVIGAYKDGYNPEYYNNKPELFNADPIVITSSGDTTVTGINFSLEGYTTPQEYIISGTVSDSLSNPIANAFVAVFGFSNGQFGFGLTDSFGDYSVGNLPEGIYYVLFYATDYAPQFYNGALTWEDATPVNLFGNVSGINAILTEMESGGSNSPGMISGNISSSNNSPLSGVMVSVLDINGKVAAYSMTNAQGKYQLDGLAEGEYTVVATKVKFESMSQNISMNTTSGMTQNLNMQLNNTLTSNDEPEASLPTGFSLGNNYPNPFNPSTTIEFSLPKSSFVNLKVYNAIGQEVASLVSRQMEAGKYSIDFNAEKLNSGIYFYKIEAGNFTETRKMVLLK